MVVAMVMVVVEVVVVMVVVVVAAVAAYCGVIEQTTATLTRYKHRGLVRARLAIDWYIRVLARGLTREWGCTSQMGAS